MIARESVVCVIPARGGSKRLPRKNLLPVAGRPLLGYSIDHALGASRIGRTVVSTDDDEIAEFSIGRGAEVVRRPAELSSDTATSESAILHALSVLHDRERYDPEVVVFIQCTCPVRRSQDIDRGVAILDQSGVDAVLSVVPRHLFLWVVENGRPQPTSYDPTRRQRSQEMTPYYVENGSIYVTRTAALRSTGCRVGGQVGFLEMGPESLVDVDTADDLAMCDAILSARVSR